MAETKKNPDRKGKVDAFKEQAKQKAAPAAKVEREYLIPVTDWQSTEVLELRGDLLEALEQKFLETYQGLNAAKQVLDQTFNRFQQAASAMQMIIQSNVKGGKINLSYKWNDGSDATPAEVEKFEKELEAVKEKQINAYNEYQASLNANKTGLVAPDGRPIGTTQNLDEVDEAGDRAVGMANEAAALVTGGESKDEE